MIAVHLALLKALAAMVPAAALCAGAIITYLNEKALPSKLQLIGAVCLLVVVVTHLCEVLRLLPEMGWGNDNSAGHYLDLVSAITGLTLLPLGYLLRVIKTR